VRTSSRRRDPKTTHVTEPTVIYADPTKPRPVEPRGVYAGGATIWAAVLIELPFGRREEPGRAPHQQAASHTNSGALLPPDGPASSRHAPQGRRITNTETRSVRSEIRRSSCRYQGKESDAPSLSDTLPINCLDSWFRATARGAAYTERSIGRNASTGRATVKQISAKRNGRHGSASELLTRRPDIGRGT